MAFSLPFNPTGDPHIARLLRHANKISPARRRHMAAARFERAFLRSAKLAASNQHKRWLPHIWVKLQEAAKTMGEEMAGRRDVRRPLRSMRRCRSFGDYK